MRGTTMNWGTIAGGQSVTPQLPLVMGGPVEVRAWLDDSKAQARNIFSSQRVLWNGYFNEVKGTVPDRLPGGTIAPALMELRTKKGARAWPSFPYMLLVPDCLTPIGWRS